MNSDEQPLKLEDFNDIASLEDVMSCIGLDRNNVLHCVQTIGLKFIDLPERQTVLDIFDAAGFVKSKSQFKKNPTQLRVNGKKVAPDAPWTFGVTAVLCFGKNRNEASVIWFRKCFENEDGTVRKP
jgi:hypothetical protein